MRDVRQIERGMRRHRTRRGSPRSQRHSRRVLEAASSETEAGTHRPETPGEERIHAMIKHYLVNKVDRYSIRFDRQRNGIYKLYAPNHPTDPFGRGVTDNHLYSDNQICVQAGHEPRTLDEAKAIAMFWCDGWSTYC